jgi:signal transduction protein with GAF and PtsI domain
MEKNKLHISDKEELKVLRRIVEVTNSAIDLHSVLNEVVSIVNDITKADSVFIYLLDKKKKSLVLKASKTPHKQELGKVNLKRGEGIAGWVAQENQSVAIKQNAFEDPRFKTFKELPEDQYEALLATPIMYKDKSIGAINIQHKKPHEYSARTVQLISLIAKQMSGVITNAQLFEETKSKALQFDSLMKVSQSITSQDYLDEILGLIVVVTAGMLNSKICSIMMLDKKGKELMIKATQALSEEYKKKPNVKVNESISGEVVKTKKPIAILDVRKEKKYGFKELAVKENFTSMLVVPMVVKNKAIGVVNVYTKKPHVFSDDEIGILQIVANQAAVAIENTHLMEDALRAKDALEARKLIERAKGVLMRLNDLSEDAAYRLIHRKSMDTCKTMKEIAESILLLEDLKSG